MTAGYAPGMLRKVILAAAGSHRVERLVESAPVSRNVVRRFIAGTGADDALRCSRELVDNGLAVTIDHLGEDTADVDSRECRCAVAPGRARRITQRRRPRHAR